MELAELLPFDLADEALPDPDLELLEELEDDDDSEQNEQADDPPRPPSIH
jgi:hypothetical protein